MPAKNTTENARSNSSLKIISELIVWACILAILGLSALNLTSYKKQRIEIVVQNTLESDFVFWQNLSNKYPSYRDAYLVMSQIMDKKGEWAKAKDYLAKAQQVDPYIERENMGSKFILGAKTEN